VHFERDLLAGKELNLIAAVCHDTAPPKFYLMEAFRSEDAKNALIPSKMLKGRKRLLPRYHPVYSR
jgi:hypothetical protein